MTEPPAPQHVWRGHPFLELRWYGELARLLSDPIMRGHGVPHGDGRSVLLLPAFLVSDQSLAPLAGFLRRIGYHPFVAGIRFNSGCGRKRRALGCLTNTCLCEFARGYRQPFPPHVRYTSIYSAPTGLCAGGPALRTAQPAWKYQAAILAWRSIAMRTAR